MAATIRASKSGLAIIDQARRKKGWNKCDKIWYGLALVGESTLKRFWAGEPIRKESFESICIQIGIKDWEIIADLEDIEGKVPSEESYLG